MQPMVLVSPSSAAWQSWLHAERFSSRRLHTRIEDYRMMGDDANGCCYCKGTRVYSVARRPLALRECLRSRAGPVGQIPTKRRKMIYRIGIFSKVPIVVQGHGTSKGRLAWVRRPAESLDTAPSKSNPGGSGTELLLGWFGGGVPCPVVLLLPPPVCPQNRRGRVDRAPQVRWY